jgi:predicted PhzF superfamily epimerase YddE/YHI9
MTKQIVVYTSRVFVNEASEFGNPVGIVLDDTQSLSTEIRQKITVKIGFSESVFINNLDIGNITIFNPVKEVNFAGHAIIGTAYFIIHTLKKPLKSLECNTGKVYFWQEDNLTWIHADLKGTPPWIHEQLQSVEAIDYLSDFQIAKYEHTMVWAWINKEQNIIRARTFALDWGIVENQGNGSGSMQLATLLGEKLEIHHGKGSIIYAKPAGIGYAEVGGIVKEDIVKTIVV